MNTKIQRVASTACHASRRRRQFVQLDDPSLFIAKHNRKYTPLRESNAIPFRLSIEVLCGSSIDELVSKAFMMQALCFLLALSVLLTSNYSVGSAARSLKVFQHLQDDGEATRRIEPAHTGSDELQSEDEGVSAARNEKEIGLSL